jgi:DnaK suppressor protein
MGKSDSRIRVKAPVTKGNHKAALNGSASARHPAEAKKHQALGQAKQTAKPVAKPARKGRARESNNVLPEGYRPSENEPFMNERQKVFFRNKLVTWKEEIIRQNRETLHILHEDSAQHADLADRATSETDRALELRARDRQRKLINKIDAALARIEEGSYGFCEETGEPIGLKRLDARPIATLSLEAQERHERREKVFRED